MLFLTYCKDIDFAPITTCKTDVILVVHANYMLFYFLGGRLAHFYGFLFRLIDVLYLFRRRKMVKVWFLRGNYCFSTAY
ncbi:hypothetical protein C7N43_13195 [Sphingobacteriales bacterium UPWRP_1]|nr:hypothetical protein BVG80_14705 [Sphingobacteriales bacterium TSM_CSM]PSJ76561.1 hypothetical protein C7N43_13195 [Sphingobacteriales bacterium UPWRP_1]